VAVVPVAELPLLPPGAQTSAVSEAAAAPVGAAATPHASAPLMRLPAATAPVATAAVAAAINAGKKRDQTGVCGNTGQDESPSRATSSRERKLDTKTI